ncbi:S-formylglutathione hydrolase [Microthyrium microscopicum]|uniref:S-formylglutathione hydrolase n=1 Tax=Microthyrium microscopicum TaxID=703497 RepID=A0A6A6UDB3_9PEZI|nr:S-formylglutathione hydrolase [Microthyrium microscopicum]
MGFETTATIASFGGKLVKLKHRAESTSCDMSLNLYLPPQSNDQLVPVLFYLAGLTCTGDNGAEKGSFLRGASKLGIAIVFPDTSPRGLDIQGEEDSWDFGTGAGFYLNATKEPWTKGYNMYSYITDELPQTLFKEFSQLDGGRMSITGHSMGGHGALTIFLKNPSKYKSCSAFAPIANPINCPWGQKAFKGYLGDDQELWKEHDATELVKKFKGPMDILIDVGTGDNFYKQGQLLPENFDRAVKDHGDPSMQVTIRMQPDYDHSYFFISSFADDHLEHAAKYLHA